MIKNFEELAQLQAVCTATMSDKFSGKGEKRAIVLCGGTGCLSSNSAEIKEKIDRILEDKGLTERVSCNLVGCFGFCSQGPFVKIFPEDTLYRLVSLEDVDEIFEPSFGYTLSPVKFSAQRHSTSELLRTL